MLELEGTSETILFQPSLFVFAVMGIGSRALRTWGKIPTGRSIPRAQLPLILDNGLLRPKDTKELNLRKQPWAGNQVFHDLKNLMYLLKDPISNLFKFVINQLKAFWLQGLHLPKWSVVNIDSALTQKPVSTNKYEVVLFLPTLGLNSSLTTWATFTEDNLVDCPYTKNSWVEWQVTSWVTWGEIPFWVYV